MDCRSIVHRILEFAEDEGAIPVNPMRKVRPPRRPVDPDKALGQTRRRALTPEEAGQLLACFPLFWWDHVVCLLGTGLRFGEFAGLRRRRVHLDHAPPVLHVVDTRYQAGKFGSGFKPQPKSPASFGPSRSPPKRSRRSAANSLPAATPTRWCSPAPAAAPGTPADRACPEEPARCCPEATSAAPTTAPWSSWPTPPASSARPPGARCGRSATAGHSMSTNSPPGWPPTAAAPSARPRSRSRCRSCEPLAWRQSTATIRTGGRPLGRQRRPSAIPCLMRSTYTGRTTSATPSPQ